MSLEVEKLVSHVAIVVKNRPTPVFPSRDARSMCDVRVATVENEDIVNGLRGYRQWPARISSTACEDILIFLPPHALPCCEVASLHGYPRETLWGHQSLKNGKVMKKSQHCLCCIGNLS